MQIAAPKETTSWGEFPSRTVEEALLEDRLDPKQIKAGRAACKKPLNELIRSLHQTKLLLENPTTRTEGEAFAYGVCLELIQREKEEPGLEDVLGRSRLFKYLPPQTAYIIATKAIRENAPKVFKKVTMGMKRENPLHPDIPLFTNQQEETLGHMAAKVDRRGILETIHKTNPDFLTTPNQNGDNVCHIASRFCAMDSLEFLLIACQPLFGKRNREGKTPLDLEAGEFLSRTVQKETIQKAAEKAKQTKVAAFAKLTEASKKPPSKNLLHPTRGRLRAERVSLEDPEI